MWGIVPAAGIGSRIQPLAFSKELLPVGSRLDGNVERPRAASEYLLDRLVVSGITKICLVISSGKSDIFEYYGGTYGSAMLCYVVQPRPEGLCNAIFQALPLIPPDEFVTVGLPDTIWFPENALCHLGDHDLSFLLFPVERPEFFDSVSMDENGQVLKIQTKVPHPDSDWIWGAFKMRGSVLRALYDLWCSPEGKDEYMGPLVNKYLERGGRAVGVRAGKVYVDVGTMNGYRNAIRMLADGGPAGPAPR
jgi:dTDP-glucose pyrophosphorylase